MHRKAIFDQAVSFFTQAENHAMAISIAL